MFEAIHEYYTLVIKLEGHWSIEFGDDDKESVECEREAYQDEGHKLRDMKIIGSDYYDNGDVAWKVSRLNGGSK